MCYVVNFRTKIFSCSYYVDVTDIKSHAKQWASLVMLGHKDIKVKKKRKSVIWCHDAIVIEKYHFL